MHREIVQKNAHIIDIRSLNIYALSWVQHNLKEHSKARFRRDYGPKVDYRRFAEKPYRRLGHLGLLGLKRLLLQYIYFPCKKTAPQRRLPRFTVAGAAAPKSEQ